MSQEDVEIPYRAAEAHNQRDIEAFLALCDPEIEWIPFHAAIEGRTYRGHPEVRRLTEEVWREWEDWRGEIERVIDLADGRLAVLGSFRARGHGSGVEVSGRYGQLWTIRDDRILRVETHPNPESALEAAGLRE